MEAFNDPPCEDCGQDLSDFLDGTADARTVERFIARMQRRDRCQRCYETYKKTTELCRRHLNKESSRDLGVRLTAFLRANGCFKEES